MPDFTRKDRPLTGAQRGTATHLVLQYMDFAAAGSLEAVRAEIERLRQKKLLSDKEAAAVDAEAIQKLFASPIGSNTHMLIYGPGSFKFTDFARLGIVMHIVLLTLALILVNIIYPLY